MSQAPRLTPFSNFCHKAVDSMTEWERKGTCIRFASGITIVAFPNDYENSDTPKRVLDFAVNLSQTKSPSASEDCPDSAAGRKEANRPESPLPDCSLYLGPSE
jgi:hypothetical protein